MWNGQIRMRLRKCHDVTLMLLPVITCCRRRGRGRRGIPMPALPSPSGCASGSGDSLSPSAVGCAGNELHSCWNRRLRHQAPHTPYVHPFIFLMKFKSAMKFSPGVCEHVASDFSNSVNYPLLYFIPFRSYGFSCFIQKLLFHVSFISYVLFHPFGELACFTLFRFAEKVNNANKKMIIQNKTAMFLGHFAKN